MTVAAGRGDRASDDGDALQPLSSGSRGSTKNLTDFFLQARCARRAFSFFRERLPHRLARVSNERLSQMKQRLRPRSESDTSWIGGAKGSRTPDLLNAIQALSQLSYGPIT
jgi:hypothetical protein